MTRRAELPSDLRGFAESFYAAANARDPDAIVALIDPEFEFNSCLSEAGTYRGAEGVREWLRDVDAAFETMRFFLDDIVVASDRSAVVEVTGRGVARGEESATEVHVVHAWKFRAGRLWRAFSFGERAEAERAARA